MKFAILFPFCVALLLLVSACKTTEKEEVVEFGKTITFDYAAGYANGTLFDTTFEVAAREAGIYNPKIIYKPLTTVYTKGALFPGLEEALLGMKEGEVKNVRIPPNKAYGIKIENSTRVLPKTTIIDYENLKINDAIPLLTQDGITIYGFVKGIGEENLTIDLNHPLAGHYIQFSIILRSIE